MHVLHTCQSQEATKRKFRHPFLTLLRLMIRERILVSPQNMRCGEEFLDESKLGSPGKLYRLLAQLNAREDTLAHMLFSHSLCIWAQRSKTQLSRYHFITSLALSTCLFQLTVNLIKEILSISDYWEHPWRKFNVILEVERSRPTNFITAFLW